MKLEKLDKLDVAIVKQALEQENNFKRLRKRISQVHLSDALKLRDTVYCILKDINNNYSNLDYNDKVELACGLLVLVEETEFSIFRRSIFSDESLQKIKSAIEYINKQPGPESFDNYSKCLTENYKSLPDIQKVEERDFYKLKCDLIDEISHLLLC